MTKAYRAINDQQQLKQLIDQHDAVLVYFSHDACGVCQVLKPKVAALFNERFPRVGLNYVDTRAYPDIAAQFSIFTVPSLLVFMQGKEQLRLARHISLLDLAQQFERGYEVLFGDN